MLCVTVLISLAAPIDKAMCYFYIITGVFSFLTLASLVGIVVFLFEQSFFPPVKILVGSGTDAHWDNADPNEFPPKFSLLTISGVVMLAIYFIPMILRPLDFLFNMKQYLIGIVSYFLLLPLFINVM
jgi:hypothetical protein